ncbi:MAG: Tad domain-containing protein [Myxococcaceae bacterium]|nr:Tad domain-containing protein [Myxococcaceae bacterium]
MISSFRKGLRNNESGQAIILGAVSLLVLAVGIMTTIQLGWSIKERIQLQHAADNAAYTSAAVVARTFNFISWNNRAIIAQYVSAMAWQSLVSWLDANAMVIAQYAAPLLNAGFIVGIVAKIPFLAWLDPVARVIGGFGHALKVLAEGIQWASNALDVVVPHVIRFISLFNEFFNYWAMQWGLGKMFLHLTVIGQIAQGNGFYQSVMTETAGSLVNQDSLAKASYVTGVGLFWELQLGVNWLSFIPGIPPSIFDAKGSEEIGSSSSNQKVKNATRLMTNLVNASREGSSGDILWETNRKDLLSEIIEEVAGGRVAEFLAKIGVTSEGGTILANPIPSEYNVDKLLGDWPFSDNKTKHPLFKSGTYESQSDLAGGAIISTDLVNAFGDGKAGFIKTVLKWISKALPIAPVSTSVGIQSTKDTNITKHCRFTEINTMADGVCDMIKEAIDNASSSSNNDKKKGCEEVCEEKEHCTETTDSEGNTIKNCETKWEVKPGASSGNENYNPKEFCENYCNSSSGSSTDALDDAIGEIGGDDACGNIDNTVYETLKNTFGGAPVRIDDSCECSNNHKFKGVTKYLSLNIERFEKDKKYPYFLAGANKNPKFPINYLGFGENKLKVSSVGSVEGPTSALADCQNGTQGLNDKFNAECLDEYNFNHLKDRNFLGMPGFHAWANAEVYYHRPGAWAEPPNFFNPYWGAKLAPMAPVFTQYTDMLGKIPVLGDLLAALTGNVISTVLSH